MVNCYYISITRRKPDLLQLRSTLQDLLNREVPSPLQQESYEIVLFINRIRLIWVNQTAAETPRNTATRDVDLR